MYSYMYFYLVKDDYVKVLNNIESEMDVKYIKCGRFTDKEDIKVYDSLTDYEYLGINRNGDMSEYFLVIPKEDKLEIREGNDSKGEKYYVVSPEDNENYIIFGCSGLYTKENALWQREEEKYQKDWMIPAYIYTASYAQKAIKLHKIFSKYIREQCKIKYNGFYVGEEAFKYYGHISFAMHSVGNTEQYCWHTEEDLRKMGKLDNIEDNTSKKVPKFIQHTIKNKRFNNANFFYLIEKQDFDMSSERALLQPLIQYLSQWDDIVIFAFDDKVSSLLFELDKKEIADKMEGFTPENFLYSRCFAVAEGASYYRGVLLGIDTLNYKYGFEGILHVARAAWAEKYRTNNDDYPHTPKMNYETYSNKDGWKK